MEKTNMIIATVTFGTIGIFVHYIQMPSSVIASVRGFLGALFLIVFCLIGKRKFDFKAIGKNLPLLFLSGIFIGLNWIFLFEAYKYTTVAVATLCYYTAPVILILFSPIFFKEKYTLKKLLCVALALSGMLLVSGISDEGSLGDIKGILLGLAAAAVYASIMIINRKTVAVNPYDRTIVQLASAFVVITPYALFTVTPKDIEITPVKIILLIVVGIFHTGFCYLLFFDSVSKLRSQTTAIMCYIDPVVAVILSALILKEKLTVWGIAGACLIIGAALLSELPVLERKKKSGRA